MTACRWTSFNATRLTRVTRQPHDLLDRVSLLRNAVHCQVAAVGCFVLTSLLLGLRVSRARRDGEREHMEAATSIDSGRSRLETEHMDDSTTQALPRKLWQSLHPFLGLAAILWFLVRVLPKPSRASYPCQQLAAGIGGGFLAYLLATLGVLPLLHRVRHRAASYRVPLVLALALSIVLGGAVAATKLLPSGSAPAFFGFVPADLPNHPVGEGKGLFPGRVAWVQDRGATRWDGASGNWWSDASTDQAAVDALLARTLQLYTGETSVAVAWNALFQHFNEAHGRGSVGYQAGERVVIKINSNQDAGTGVWDNGGYNSPHLVYSVVRQLVEVVGVEGADVTIADPSRYIGNPIYDKIRSNPGADYQAVRFVVKPNLAKNGRVGAVADTGNVIHFVPPYPGDPNIRDHYPPTCNTEATYLINLALLRTHTLFGVTLSGKSYFGMVHNGTEFRPDKLHGSGVTTSPLGNPHCHPVLLGDSELGGKTLLFVIDGLYTAIHQGSKSIVKWQTLGNDWCSSLLVSQDPVAVDSVAVDLLRNEPGMQIDALRQNVCNYLHEAALADSPPSGAIYDPEGDGTRLGSLGVHEHWSNAVDRRYTRDLGAGSGIELVRDVSGLKLLTPAGGVVMKQGSVVPITWLANGLRNDVKISLWRNGVQAGLIASGVAAGSGRYGWTVGALETGAAPLGGGYCVKVKEVGYTFADTSVTDLLIAELKVTSPNGGESLVRDSIHQITWQAGGFSGGVKITLWQGDTRTGIIAADVPASPGSFAWRVGEIAGGSAPRGSGYTIKIKAKNLYLDDSSNGTFSLVN